MSGETGSLLGLQRRVAAAVMQPLAAGDRMCRDSMREAKALIRPNNRLSSFERLEIYNRQYWFRLLSCLAEDFPGLRAIIGARAFDKLARSYLTDCPSISFTLRNLGSRLVEWLQAHPQWLGDRSELALDMVRLEWAHVEAFDEQFVPPLTLADLSAAEEDVTFGLQPYLRLLQCRYAVDDLLIEVRRYQGDSSTASNAARSRPLRNRVKRYSLAEGEALYLAVHRYEDSVYYKRLTWEAFVLLQALSGGRPLEDALGLAFESTALSDNERLVQIQEWFTTWSELGWFCRPERNRT